MRRWWFGAATLAAVQLAGSGPAAAQSQPIPLADGAPYIHRHSGLTIPATLDGIPRVKAQSAVADQLDDAVDFALPEAGEEITVYLFRHVTGSAALWFDQARWQIEHREVYGELVPLDRSWAFTPPHQTTASALMRVYGTGKGPYRSTGLALVPVGPDWFVAVRYTSRTHSAEALATHLQAVISQFGWPERIAEQPAAVPIAACAEPLAATKRAKTVERSGADALIASVLALPNLPATQDGPPPVWCRDATDLSRIGGSGVYRTGGPKDGYLIALADSGRGIRVDRDISAVLLGKGKGGWNVSNIDLDRTTVFPTQDRVPPPEQAVEIVQAGHALSTTTTWGAKGEVTIDSKTLK